MENYYRGLIPATNTEIIYSPINDLKLTGIIICNIGVGGTVDLYITDAAVGAVTTADAIMYAYPIDAGYNLEVPDKILPKGCRLVAKADTINKFSISVDVEVL